jgi:2-amino-4-hydroxy-6-hydroxymethyldihydropteridine diphosphokinase
VMGPLAQIAPDWVHPVLGETAAALAARATVGRDARPLL